LLPKGREKNQNKRKEKKKGDEDCTESTLTKLSKQFFFNCKTIQYNLLKLPNKKIIISNHNNKK